MNIGDCVALSRDITDLDRDALLARVDDYARSMPLDQAQRIAAEDTLAEIIGERTDARRLVRDQAAELFQETPVAAATRAAPDERVRMMRGKEAAEASGFNTDITYYHGTAAKKDFKKFKVGRGGVDELGPGVYVTTLPHLAGSWAGYSLEDGGRVLPLYIRDGDLFDIGEFRRNAKDWRDLVPLAQRLKNSNEALSTQESMTAPTDELWKTWLAESDENLAKHLFSMRRPAEINVWLSRAGYVGAYDGQSQIPGQVVVFKPDDVRSIFDTKKERGRVRQSRQVGTPEFKRWFGDSKVVDENGEPLVVYHGTHREFSEFSSGKSSPDYWFTDSPGVASLYAATYTPPPDGEFLGQPNVMPSYLKMERPLEVDAEGRHFHLLDEAILPDGFEVDRVNLTSDVLALLAKKRGYDGVIFRNMIDGKGKYSAPSTVYAVFEPAQIKSAIGNRGTFDPNDPDIRNARGASGFDLPVFGRWQQFVQAIQDRYNRFKQTIESIRQQGGVVTEANDFYRAEERYWGIVGSKLEDFRKDVDAFIEAVAADGLALSEVQAYAYAKHAKERNAALRAQRQPNGRTGFDSWSGMTDSDAQDIIDNVAQAGLTAVMEKHQQKLQDWVNETREVMLDQGLITNDEFLRLSSMFDNYVPLRGNANVNPATQPRRTGSGFNVRGRETIKARGRYTEADQIIENIIQDRTRALIRAGKNEVLRSFLQFVLDNPSENLWEVNAVESKPLVTVDDQGNQVIEEVNQVVKDDRTVSIKDGGREVYIKINDVPLREQMRNMHVEQVGKILGVMLMAQRMLGKLYTALSPTFTVINWLRDVQTATFGMIDEIGFKAAARVWGNIPKALWESYRAEFGSPGQEYQLYRTSGGKTGFFDFKDIDTLTRDLQRDLANAERSALDPRVFGPKALELIEKINAGIENSTRLASFMAARSEGKSVAESASISKNITVNFNRKGTMTPALSAFFLFFNPAVQGSARIAQALKSPKVLATLGAAMTGVAALALRNASMGDDDDGVAWWDKIPAETKDRNLIIILPPGSSEGNKVPGSKVGRYVKIPMPYGWNFFATTANQAVDVWRNSIDPARGRKLSEGVVKSVNSFLGAYVPVQEAARSFENQKSAVLAAVPDFLNPIAQSIMNVNSFGRQMYPDDQFNKSAPDSSKYFAGQAGTIFQKGAEKVNELTGGNRFKSGMIDVTPATLETLARSYGGGPASFVLDMLNAAYVRQSIQRPDLDTRRLPFVKQLYGQIDNETDRMMGYERMDKISEAASAIEQASKTGTREEVLDLIKEAGPIAYLGGAVEATRENLSTIRKQELAIINSDQPDAVKYVRIQNLDAQKRLVLQGLNAAYAKAVRMKPTESQPSGQ